MSIGKIYEMSKKFEDYSYIILGEGAIGKTTLARDLGVLVTGHTEGTLILTCGQENKPKHIKGKVFGTVVPDFLTFVKYVRELCKERNTTYSKTKFIAIDSLDEFFRITEKYVVKEYNDFLEKSHSDKAKSKSIKSAYGGYQGGEDRTVELAIEYVGYLLDAGYQFIGIGHTKVKSEKDKVTQISYDKLTCSILPKYYNALKDKVNLVVQCYNEKVITDVKDIENAFSKKTEKKGKLVSTKRVMIFRDDDNAMDTKTHFPHIVNKIDFSAKGLIEAVEDAIKKNDDDEEINIQPYFRPTIEETPTEDVVEDDNFEEIEDENFENISDINVEENNSDNENYTNENNVNNEVTEQVESINVLRKEVSDKFKTADNNVKAKAREIINAKGVNLMNADIDTLKQILEIL